MLRLPLAVVAALIVPATAAAAPTALTDLRRYGDRVHVAHVGLAGLRAGAMTAGSMPQGVSTWDDFVVIAQQTDAVRIVVDDDDARLFLWVSTDDLAWTVVRSTRIVGRGATGVWVLPGAPIEIAGDSARVAATYDDANVKVDGTIARTALVHVFKTTREPAAGDHNAITFARDPDGALLVTTQYGLGVSTIGRGPDDWLLVEHRSRYLRVVGWVRRAELSDDLMGLGGITGGSYGMTDSARIEVPAGACLLDPDGGAIVGIQTKTNLRYAGDLGGGRWSVVVGNAWGQRDVVVHDRAAGSGKPRWQMCK